MNNAIFGKTMANVHFSIEKNMIVAQRNTIIASMVIVLDRFWYL